MRGRGSTHRLVFAFLASAACNVSVAETSPPTARDGGITPFTEAAMRAARVALRTNLCAAIERCDPVALLVMYGSTAGCVGADASVEELALDYGYGTVATPEDVRSCAGSLALATCEDYVRYRYERIVPDACRVVDVGTLAGGSSCGAASQCASAACVARSGAPRGSCGVCVARVPVGGACTVTEECEPGTACLGPVSGKTCRRLAASGEACDASAACRPHLRCTAGRCDVPVDDTCEPAFGCASVPIHRHCSVATRTCVPSIARPGEACGWQPDRGIVACPYGSTCARVRSSAPGPSETAPTYACQPTRPLGSACQVVDHPFDSPCTSGVCHQSRCQRNAAPQCSAPEVPP